MNDEDGFPPPWITGLRELEEPGPNQGFEPFKLRKNQIEGLTRLIVHAALHLEPELDEIEAEILVKELLSSGEISPKTACDMGKCLQYAALVNSLPENANKSN